MTIFAGKGKEIKAAVLRDYYAHFKDDRFKHVLDKDFYWQDWNGEPWIRGAFTSCLKPNTWTQYGETGWRKPAGNIFRAGTEVSDRWPGCFDGAPCGEGCRAERAGLFVPSQGGKLAHVMT